MSFTEHYSIIGDSIHFYHNFNCTGTEITFTLTITPLTELGRLLYL